MTPVFLAESGGTSLMFAVLTGVATQWRGVRITAPLLAQIKALKASTQGGENRVAQAA